ncbi:LamG-like jellyroll fold domain-containing protein, partial [Candidatus Omnitrophota bacterium]
MHRPNKLKISLKVISVIIAVIFFWDQVIWAADIIDPLSDPMNDPSGSMDPSSLESSQAAQQSHVDSMNAIEDFTTYTSDHGQEYTSKTTISGWTRYYMDGVLVEKKYTDGKAYVYAEHYEDGKVRTTRYYGTGDVFLWESVDHYDGNGKFSGKTITYSSGRIYEKDENYRDVRITYTSGEYVEYLRDEVGKVHYETHYDAGGQKLYEYEYIYGANGAKAGHVLEYVDGKAYHYDIDGYLTKEVQEGGYYFLYKGGYKMGRAVTTEYYEPDDTLTKTITYDYDGNGSLLGRTIDYANDRVSEQDRYFRTDKITYASGEYLVYTRHPDGRNDETTYHDTEENVLYRQVFNYDGDGNSEGIIKTYNTGLIEEFSPEWKLQKKTEANGVIYNYYISGRVKDREVPEEEIEGELFGKRVKYHYRDEDTSGEYGRIERIDVIDAEVLHTDNSLRFDGEDDYVVVADADELSCGDGTSCTPMTIVADIYFEKNDASLTILYKAEEYAFGVSPNGGLYFQIWDNNTHGCAGVAMPMGVYLSGGRHHLVVTFNGTGGRDPGDVKLFVDGAQIETWDIGGYIFEATENADSDLTIGGNSWEMPPTHIWNGGIYDIKLYGEELSTGQIEDLSLRKHLHEGLVSHWDFSEGGGDILIDKVGGNDGVVHGALWENETLNKDDGYYYENRYLDPGNPSDITIDRKTKANLTTEALIEEYDRLETLPDGTVYEFEYKVLSPRRRMVKETLPAGAYKEYDYWPGWGEKRLICYFLPDGTLFMREGCDGAGAVESTSLFHENGNLKEIRRTDSTWEEYAEGGAFIRSGMRAGDIEVIYDGVGRIAWLISGLYEEERKYVYSSEGDILYTLALKNNVIKAVRDGYYEGLDLVSREYENEMANAVTVTYDDHVTISYDGGEIKALSADDGYVNFYSGSDIIYQNSAFGDLYCFENGFLKRIATISGNVYNFDTVYFGSDASVVLSGAAINGTVCEFIGSNLSALLVNDIRIDILEMVLKNDLKIDILKIDRGEGEEVLVEGDALYGEIETVLQTARRDIPNIRFDYSPDLAIQRILTSDHSEIFLEGDLISKIISTEGVEVVYEFIEEVGEITGLRLLEEGVVRTFDKAGNLVSIEFPEGGETTTLTFEGGELDNITSADSVMRDITYTADGDIDSARLMNPNGVEYFFTGGTLSSFLDSGNVEHEVGEDGKVSRLVRVDTGEVFVPAYLVDPDDGKEIVVFTQEGSRTKYIYKEEVLRTIVDPTGLTIDYLYDSEGRTQEIGVSYGGVRESTYSFEYGELETIVTDDVGNKRFFDEEKRATKLKTPYGDMYSYVYDVNINGDPITVVNYTEKDQGDGTKVQYFKGQVQRIDRPDGSWIDNVHFDPMTQELKRFSFHTPEGDHRNILMEGKFVQIEMEDATRLVFYENTLVAFANSQGIVPLYDIEGLDETIYLRDRTSTGESELDEIDVAASSWRHQTYEDSRAIRFVERDFVNEEWLVSLDLRTGDQEYSQGEMYLDLRYDIPGLEYQSPIDMRGKEISFLMQLGDDFEHDPNYPCNVQVFAKDANWNTQYGTKVELVDTSGWIRVTLVPTEDSINFGYTDSGFDPSSIVMFGLRITEPDFAPGGKNYLGDVRVKHDILPDLFENVSYEESPLDDLYSGLGLLRDLDRLHEEPEVTDAELYLESFVNALGDGPGDLFEESLLKSISWHPERETTHINGVESVYRDTVTDEVVLNMDMSSLSEDRTEGEVFFNVTSDVPGLNWNGPVNLTSRSLRVLVEVPQGMVGASYAPTGARIFVEDENMNLQYGTWVNLKEGGKWYQLELTPTFGEVPMGSTDEGFDPSKIKKIGINFATQPNSGVDFMGEVRMKFLDGASDLDSGTTINTPLWMDLRNIKEYLVDENDNYIRVPFVNYLSESHFGYVFNQGSGVVPTANFEAIEAHNTNWQTQHAGIGSVGWNSDALVANMQFSSYSFGEMLLDVRYSCWVPDKNWHDNSSLDMSSQQVVFYVRPTQDVLVPFSVEAFAQSTSSWRIQYSERVTVSNSEEWVKLVLTPSPTDFMGEFRYTQSGFDPSQIVGLGLKFSSSTGTAAYTGPVEIRYEVNDVNLGVNDLGATDKLPGSPVWVNQRDLGSYLRDNEIALYGDYRVMEEVNRLVDEVPEYTLPSDFVAMTVFDKNDKVSSISKPDGTTTHFNDNSQIDYIEFEDGSRFVDYEYDTSGRLVRATLASAREKLDNAIGDTVLEVERKTTDTLLLLAEQHKLLEEDYMEDVNATRRQFASARAGLEAQRYYEVRHWFLFFSWTERKERPEVVAALADLRAQETAFNRQVAEELAKLSDEISAKRDEIVAEKNIVLEEYAWQEKKMFLAILHEEAIPIMYYYYRNVLGRDATQEEMEAILRRIDENSDFAGFLESDLFDLEAFTGAVRGDAQNPVYLALSEETRLFVDGFSSGDTPKEGEITSLTKDLDDVIKTYDLYSVLASYYESSGGIDAVLSDGTKAYRDG